jgi:chemotaxis protein CheX
MPVIDTNPFRDAVHAVFSTMIRLDVTTGQPFRSSSQPHHDATATIRLSGDITGSVILSLPQSVASSMISKLAGCDFVPGSPEFSDALGEIANMISGAAKSRYKNRNVSISTPTVSIGPAPRGPDAGQTASLALPFQLRSGGFCLLLDLQETPSVKKIA